MDEADRQHLPAELATLPKFAAWLRSQEEAADGTLSDKDIAVTSLVDEIKKVEDDKPRAAMLNRLAEVQQSQLRDDFVSLVMVTSLDVHTFQAITRKSQRPVFSVPLPQ